MPTASFTPHAQPDESPLSLLQRAALGNGWESLRQACSAMFHCGGEITRFIRSILLNRIRYVAVAQRLGIHPNDANALAYQRVTSTTESKVKWQMVAARSASLRLMTQPYCPHCLLEYRYSRDLWGHRLVSACLKHGCWLVDHSSKPDGASINLLNHDWPAQHELAALCLNSKLAPPIVIDTMTILFLNTDSELLERLDTCFDLASRWADWGLLASDDRTLSIAACEFFAGRWPQNIRDTLTETGGTTRQLAHPRCLVFELMRSDVPGHQSLAADVLKNAPLQLMSVCFRDNDVIPRALAKKVLGMNITEVDKLGEKGIIEIGERGISISSCSTLLCRLEDMPTPTPPLAGMSRALRQLKPISTSVLIGDLLGRKISACRFDRSIGINSLQIQASDLQRQIVSTEYVALEDVAKLCGVHRECIRFISSRTSFLNPVEQSGRSAKYRFREEDVAEFHGTYVFAGALAGELKVGRTTLAAKLHSAGLTAVSGPRIDGGLTFLFLRKDLNHLDLQAIARTVGYATNAGRKRNTFVAPTLPGVPLKIAAARLGISLQSCRYLFSKDMLVRVPHHGRGLFVTEQSVADLIALYSEPLLSTHEAGKRFNQTAAQFSATWVHTGLIRRIVLSGRAGFLPHDVERLQAQLGDQTIPRVWCREHGYQITHARNRLRRAFTHNATQSGQPAGPFLISADQLSLLLSEKSRLRPDVIR